MNSDEFKELYFLLMEKSVNLSLINPIYHLKISTMTCIGDLFQTIDTVTLTTKFKSTSYPICTLKKTKNHHEYEESIRGKKRLSFYNQVTINYTDTTNKSIKIFSNGKIQITGLTSFNETISCLSIIEKILFDSLGITLSNKCVNSLSIALINSNFAFHNNINILKLKPLLTSHSFKVDYKPDVYPGLKIKHPTNNSSIFIFKTGNVVLTGIKNLNALFKTFEDITSIILNNYDYLKLDTKTIVKQKKLSLHSYGYPINQYNAVS
tara:strand:- start:2064 stop:2858 length:795 start_codon:yes stop_codon:yes gene_type:complete